MRYIVTNFAYGTGPYLRTTELALALNRRMEGLGRERFGIIAPWVYGEKQRRIMLEEFSGNEKKHPSEILLDAELGRILNGVFYGNNAYEEALRLWIESGDELSREAQNHLRGSWEVEELGGGRREVSDGDIALEISRAPRLTFGISPSYYTTFGYVSEILRAVLEEPQDKIAVDRDIVKRAIPIAEATEKSSRLHFVAEPGTFSFRENRPLYPSEITTPPTINSPRPNDDPIAEGIYVTITGIPGLERLYGEAERLGLKLYSNDPVTIPGSEKLLPHIIPNPRIKIQFARSGWGSVWLSQLSGTPLVTPNFNSTDDPEIYFNNICIERLGLGIIYRGQPLKDILDATERLRPSIVELNQRLLTRFGTLDGNAYIAKHIADDFSARVKP